MSLDHPYGRGGCVGGRGHVFEAGGADCDCGKSFREWCREEDTRRAVEAAEVERRRTAFEAASVALREGPRVVRPKTPRERATVAAPTPEREPLITIRLVGPYASLRRQPARRR